MIRERSATRRDAADTDLPSYEKCATKDEKYRDAQERFWRDPSAA
jgi:hypothetical protein